MLRAADNPFTSHRIENIPMQLQTTHWPELLQRLERLAFRACILGPQGSGKTTLLEQIEPHLKSRGWQTHLLLHHARRPEIPWRKLPRMGNGDLLLLDGADLLPWWEWWQLRRATKHLGGLLVVSHTRKLLPVLHTCTTSADLLEQLLAHLVPGSAAKQRQNQAQQLFARHGGNIREAFREAYDQAAINFPGACLPPGSAVERSPDAAVHR